MITLIDNNPLSLDFKELDEYFSPTWGALDEYLYNMIILKTNWFISEIIYSHLHFKFYIIDINNIVKEIINNMSNLYDNKLS